MAARPRVVAALAAHLRDLDVAEEAFAGAAASCLALAEPPRDVPAWLFVAGKRRALDALRKARAEARTAERHAEVAEMADILTLPEPIPDERLRLLFICCHPAIAPEARTALALKVICGLPVSAIARLFVVSEATMFQRITRAKLKVREAGIAFELPPRRDWPARLEAVLLALELAFTAAYADAGGELSADLGEDLGGEVERLALLVAELLPEEPEALGLAALVLLARSRAGARVDGQGAMVPLSQQDCALWDGVRIERARALMAQAARAGRSGPCQVMAAIQLTHARRAFDGVVDWSAVLRLYDVLQVLRPSPMVALSRALALAQVEGAEAGLAALAALPAERLALARPFHVARADLLARTGQAAEARAALDAALVLDPPRAERLWLEARRAGLV
ncbi:MAG: sigma factor-like helix-turn-helix DNA-binding protein [Porphyrobacter sp.]|jgi:RNA polymerase sigma-70 factor (ECF subfamily)|nr:sigma factor-like helix-turn-helix DNA-binding protein [Porphyrobacter sp.]